MPQNIILDKIRKLILLKTGIKTISPADCRMISNCIQKEIQKNISETTLKRLFGFAEIKNKFSKYTINALLEYVEKTGNYELVERELLHNSSLGERFSAIRNNALEITQNTLKSLKNRCGVPFNFTIPRVFARFDFEYFYDSSYSFTAFISQAGYGKSTLLSHLVQELFLAPEAKYRKDVVLFVTARDIFDDQNEYTNLESRIKAKLGLTSRTNFLTYFKEKYERNDSKLVIVIDGFSDLITTSNSKPLVFDKLITLMSCVGDDPFVKVIFSMRSTLWSRFYDRIRNIPFIHQKWFPGTYFNIKDQSNIPPLTIIEIEEILKRMHPKRSGELCPQLKEKLKYPFYIQWYYLLKEEFPDFDSYTNILFFEIINRFIHEKVYHTAYATEKVLFCRKIIMLSAHGKGRKTVPKSALIAELSNFKNAYKELLSEGILMEEKQEAENFPIELVRFVHPHVFEYFLFIELLNDVDNKMDRTFFENINHKYAGNPVRFQVLQWSARLLIIKSELSGLEYILGLNLSNYEKTYLIYFIAENINYRLPLQPSLNDYLRGDDLHQMMMGHIIHFDFIDSCYKEAVSSLLAVSRNKKYTLLYHVILSVYDCLELDIVPLQHRLAAMQTLRDEGKMWSIDPVPILECIYGTLTGRPDCSSTIKAVEVYETGQQQMDRLPTYEEMLSFLLMIIANVFHGHPNESTSLINAVTAYYPKMVSAGNVYPSYLSGMMAFIMARANMDGATASLSKHRSKIGCADLIANATPYIQAIHLSAKAYASKNSKDYKQAIVHVEECIKIFKRNKFALGEIMMYQLMIDIYKATTDEDKKTHYTHQKLQLIDQKKLDPSIFHLIKN